MQRIALSAGVLVAALSGCAKPTKITARPLPDPLFKTRHPTPPRIEPAPLPRRPAPRVARRPPSAELDERALIPPGGIQRGRWNVIVVHHSANDDDTPASIDDYHRNQRGWANGLGYHFVIGNGVNTPDGRVYAGSRWKRQISGAHCKSPSGRYFGVWRRSNYFNTHGIGICLIGNFEKHRPTPRQLTALQQLTQLLCSKTGIDPTYIYGHRDVTHKTLCPGRYLCAKLPQVRAAVAQALAVTLDDGPPPGWPSGLDDQFAPRANVYLHRALLSAHLGLKGGNVMGRSRAHAFDHVADLCGGTLGGAVLCDVDHDHTDCGGIDAHPVAGGGREVCQPHATPHNRPSPHPTNAADLAALHGSLHDQTLLAAR